MEIAHSRPVGALNVRFRDDGFDFTASYDLNPVGHAQRFTSDDAAAAAAMMNARSTGQLYGVREAMRGVYEVQRLSLGENRKFPIAIDHPVELVDRPRDGVRYDTFASWGRDLVAVYGAEKWLQADDH